MSRVSRRENRTKVIQILILFVTVCISAYCIYLMQSNKEYKNRINSLQQQNEQYVDRIDEMEAEIYQYKNLLQEIQFDEN